tara:strand:- start:111 stop:1622 length:1512 start_codon:yes stop_codon:yes gene_type:complete
MMLLAGDEGLFFYGLGQDDIETGKYREALRNHLFEYLWYNHVAMPLFTIKNAIIQNLFSENHILVANYILVMSSGVITSVLCFLCLLQLNVGRFWAMLVTLVITFRLALWETWGRAESWDSLNPFFVTLLVWSVIRFLSKPSMSLACFFSITSTLLVLNHTFGFFIIIAIICSTIFLNFQKTRLLSLMAIASIAPLITIAGLSIKNGVIHDLWRPTSGAGQNIIQNLNMAIIDPDGRGARKLGEMKGYPTWWVWCYDEAEKARKRNPEKFAAVAENVLAFYGACISKKKEGLDYKPIKKWLSTRDEPFIKEIITTDEQIEKNKPYLWSGPIGIRATGFSLQYGKVSTQLFWDVLQTHPVNFMGRVFDNLFKQFLWEGGNFLVTQNRSSIKEPIIFYYVNFIGMGLFYLGWVLTLILFLFVFFKQGCASVFAKDCWVPTDELKNLSILTSMFLVVSGVSAALACCENYRHAFSFFPLSLILAASLMNYFCVKLNLKILCSKKGE